jgi:hypothetical protein
MFSKKPAGKAGNSVFPETKFPAKVLCPAFFQESGRVWAAAHGSKAFQ